MDARYAHPLRTARRRQNLTIDRLAEAAKVGASTVWRAEHAYPINAESRRRLCAYLGMTSEELGLVMDRREKVIDDVGHAVSAPGASSTPSAAQAAHPLVVFHHFPDGFSQQAQPSSEQDMGVWLASAGSDLAALFDAGWSLESVLDSLRVGPPGRTRDERAGATHSFSGKRNRAAEPDAAAHAGACLI